MGLISHTKEVQSVPVQATPYNAKALLLASEVRTGKTHFCLANADAVFDLEYKIDDELKAKFAELPRICTADTWKDLFDQCLELAKDSSIRTIAFDTVRKLELMAERDAIESMSGDRKTLFSKDVGPAKYHEVNDRLAQLTTLLRSRAHKHVIYTCHMKEKWIDGRATGIYIPEAPKSLHRDVNFVIQRVSAPAWPSDPQPSGIPPWAVFFRVINTSSVAPWEVPPYVVAPSKNTSGDLESLIRQLGQPIHDGYWDELVSLAKGVVE